MREEKEGREEGRGKRERERRGRERSHLVSGGEMEGDIGVRAKLSAMANLISPVSVLLHLQLANYLPLLCQHLWQSVCAAEGTPILQNLQLCY